MTQQLFKAQQPPKVVFWFKVYCWMLLVLYIFLSFLLILLELLLILGLLIGNAGEEALSELVGNTLFNAVLIVVCVPMAIMSAIPLFFPPKPWLWGYSILLISLGFTSCCFWPICIPLLIFWIRDDVQIYYGWKKAPGDTTP